MLQAGRSQVRFPMKKLDFFQFTFSFQPHYGSGVDSTSNRNDYRNLSGSKGRPARKDNNFTAIFKPIV
jgi:hypothetical protein